MKLKESQNLKFNKPLITGYVFLALVFAGAVSSVYYWEYKAKTAAYQNQLNAPKHVESGEQQVPRVNGAVCESRVTFAKNKNTGEVRDFPTPCHVNEYWTIIQ